MILSLDNPIRSSAHWVKNQGLKLFPNKTSKMSSKQRELAYNIQ